MGLNLSEILVDKIRDVWLDEGMNNTTNTNNEITWRSGCRTYAEATHGNFVLSVFNDNRDRVWTNRDGVWTYLVEDTNTTPLATVAIGSAASMEEAKAAAEKAIK